MVSNPVEVNKPNDCEKKKRYNPHTEKRIDDTVIAAICGLDLFIAQANSQSLATMARILTTAKEDLVYWAVKMKFHETVEEKFINTLLYRNNMFAAADYLNAFDSKQDQRPALRQNLKKSTINNPLYSLIHEARRLVTS